MRDDEESDSEGPLSCRRLLWTCFRFSSAYTKSSRRTLLDTGLYLYESAPRSSEQRCIRPSVIAADSIIIAA